MSLFRRKGPYDIDNAGLDRRLVRKDKQPAPPPTPEQMRRAKRTMLLLIANTMLSIVLYFACAFSGFPAIMFVYIGAAAALLVAYLIYNEGFSLRGVTPEMLPDTLSEQQKRDKLDRAKARYEASRWMMTLIIPLIFAVIVDALYLFFIQDLLLLLGVTL